MQSQRPNNSTRVLAESRTSGARRLFNDDTHQTYRVSAPPVECSTPNYQTQNARHSTREGEQARAWQSGSLPPALRTNAREEAIALLADATSALSSSGIAASVDVHRSAERRQQDGPGSLSGATGTPGYDGRHDWQYCGMYRPRSKHYTRGIRQHPEPVP